LICTVWPTAKSAPAARRARVRAACASGSPVRGERASQGSWINRSEEGDMGGQQPRRQCQEDSAGLCAGLGTLVCTSFMLRLLSCHTSTYVILAMVGQEAR